MECVQHPVSNKPVGVRHIELRIGTVAVERTIELAGQFPTHLQEWCVTFKGNWRDVRADRFHEGILLHNRRLLHLYIVKMLVTLDVRPVKANLYSVKITS